MMKRWLVLLMLTLGCVLNASAQNDYTLTPNLQLKKPKLGSTNWGTYVNQDFDTLDAAVGSIKGGYLDVPYNPSLTYNLAQGNTFVTVLNGNVIASNVAGTPTLGQFMYVIVCQNAAGLNTYTFPANFAAPLPTITSIPNGCSGTSWQWTSASQWVNVGGGVSGATGCTPSGPNGTYQKSASGSCSGAIVSDNGATATVAGALSTTGAVINQSTTTMQGIIDALSNTRFGGPNPSFDLTSPVFGGYYGSGSATCSIAATTTTLTCTSNPDFANGQGVVVNLAGAMNTLPSAPAVNTVTPVGVINGATTYSYQVVFEDYFGSLTAPGAAGSTAVGAATLGVNNISVSGVVRSGSTSLETFTCSANCNISTNVKGQISGFTGGTNSLVNGTVTINSTPLSTTFTVQTNGLNDYTESASGTLAVRACNVVTVTGTASQESTILRSWWYRNGTLAGVVPGQDPFYVDCGDGVTGKPSYVPNSLPVSAQVGYLSATIVSGGTTNNMTLSTPAVTTASTVTVLHDNTPALKAAWVAAYAAHGGIIRLPPIPANTTLSYPFNSTVDLASIPNPTQAAVRLELSLVGLNQPLIPSSFSEIDGIPQTNTSFLYKGVGFVGGSGFPLVLINHNSAQSITFKDIKFFTSLSGQSAIVADHNTGGGGEVGLVFHDVGFSGNNASAVIIKGGFDFWFYRGVCSVSPAQWYAAPCMRFTSASTYLGTPTQVPGRVVFQNTNFAGGTSVEVDDYPQPSSSSGGGNLFLSHTLHESYRGPALRINMGVGFAYGFLLDDAVIADQANGIYTPLVDAVGSTATNNYILFNNKGQNGIIMVGGSSFSAPLCINNVFFSGCGPAPFQNITGANSVADAGTLGVQDSGSMGYLLSPPAAPTSCPVSGGGSVPVGTHVYQILATDRSPISFSPTPAGMTVLGPSCSATTSGGNQTVTINRPALPTGATGWAVWRDSAEANLITATGSCVIPIPAATTSYVDTSSFTCAFSQPTTPTAFSSGINSTGMNTISLTMNSESFTASPRAEQNVFLPGALTTTWTGATWTLDKAVTVTRVQVQMKTAPVTCSPNAIVRLSDGSTNQDVTVSAAANDSGAITKAYAAGAVMTVAVQTAAAGCGTSPSDANVVVQYRMQ
jgi:hypothetical protein